ncbi:Carboxylic ester hydrolase [Fusarium keratoplasticum]|uniref:Carboxylic ester hydrolase n=1 Tax=Fusarium keratoplasticum TaxID=1328300 RepID=A0ACC0R009_9HYPO|nr:Carboxylic ester hydrolase [Fusarium keratoplasticum]KAI8671160.1 Carboxylic ester hydrolase [Fusarium keratoplasticum]
MSTTVVTPKVPEVSSEESRRTSDHSAAPPEQPPVNSKPKRKRWILILSIVGAAIVVILALTLGLYFGLKKSSGGGGSNQESQDGTSTDSTKNETNHAIEDNVVDLGYSKYRGRELGNGITVFLGMRFAKAPVDDLRWRAPVAPESTEGIQSAEDYGKVCPGVKQGLGGQYHEDCLFVNVWTPATSNPDKKLPVMVYFQSGGYILDSAPYTNGTQLIETSGNNMIFVTFNYRVGLFGFLAGKDVKEDGDLNVGLLDQRMVLKWIQEHISKFGGDPDHVVIHGQSAGAGSVALHLVAYSGKDESLFAGVISESTFMPGQPKFDDLEYQYEDILTKVDCLDAKDRMACLRGKSSEDLQQFNRQGPFADRTYPATFYWAPCTDGDMFPDYPSKLYERGDFVKVPLLFGACTNEGSNYAVNAGSSAQFIRFMLNEYPYLTDNDTETILDLYPREPSLPKHDIWFPSASRAYGEVTFICPVNNILNAVAENYNSTDIWSYRYNVQIKDFVEEGRGVPHVANAPAVFGPDMLASRSRASYYTYNAPMVPIIMNYWISFVRALDPNKYRYEDTPRWENWGDDQRRLVFELGNLTMESVDRGEIERCEAWWDMGNSTKQ